MEHILSVLSRRYPQLLFPIVAGISTSSEYRNAVYLGKEHAGSLDYSMSEKDKFMRVDTPVGSIDVLLLYNRTDFEKCVCALAHRCEPRLIPDTVGAFLISGLTNWEKVHAQYANRGINKVVGNGANLSLPGKNIRLFLDQIILLSSGWYSGLSPEAVGLSNEDWLEKSVTIRMYHEIAHFVCRSRNPENTSVFRDEVFADMIGMIAAFGHYDAKMAKVFLGITGDTTILPNARIRYYLKGQDAHTVSKNALFWISWLANRTQQAKKENINDLIVNIFEEMLCVEYP